MKRSLILLLLVLTFASTSCFLLKSDERVEVVIAATDLSAGTTITEKDITVSNIPVSKMTSDMPRKRSQVVGHATKVAISRGELILLSEMK